MMTFRASPGIRWGVNFFPAENFATVLSHSFCRDRRVISFCKYSVSCFFACKYSVSRFFFPCKYSVSYKYSPFSNFEIFLQVNSMSRLLCGLQPEGVVRSLDAIGLSVCSTALPQGWREARKSSCASNFVRFALLLFSAKR